MTRAPFFQLARYRSLHNASIALKRQAGEWRFTGLILGGVYLFGFLRPVERMRRVRREHRRFGGFENE